MVKCFHQSVEALVVGIVLPHAYFLNNNSPLSLYQLFGEVRIGDENQKCRKGLLHLLGSTEKIHGLCVSGIGIGIGTVFGKALGDIAAIRLREHSVLQIMGNTIGNGGIFVLSRYPKAIVDRAVFGSENRVGGG